MTERDRMIVMCLARGMTISQTADHVNLSTSSIEKRLVSIKRERNARTVTQLVYDMAKAGLIIACGLAVLYASELRRNVRLRRREQYAEFVQSYHKPGDCEYHCNPTRPFHDLLTVPDNRGHDLIEPAFMVIKPSCDVHISLLDRGLLDKHV